MKGKNMDITTLNAFHLDILKEIGNIGAGNAATALAKLLDKKVDMKVPQIRIMGFSDVNEVLGGAETPVVGILLGVLGDITGYILFVLEQDAASLLVNILMGNPLHQEMEYTEITLSALKEVGNILTGSYLSALSTLTGLRIMPDVPALAIDMAGAIMSVPAIELGKSTDTVLYIETEFIQGTDRVIGDFFLVPDADSYVRLLNTLGAMC
jgi:chemotaxis protein CheC